MPSSKTATAHLNILKTFRQQVYDRLGPARDALFELSDAVLLTPAVNSFAEFSLSPAFRRRWPSLYEAVQDGRPDRLALLETYLAQMTAEPRPIWMGDHTAWPRPKAKTLRDRTVEHQPTPIPGAKPITVGQGYSTLAWVPEAQGSWALPLLHERIPSSSDPMIAMAHQLAQVVIRSPGRGLGVFDAEYGNARFVQLTALLACDKIVRLRSNLCLYTAPGPYRGRGRPPVHGRKFKFRDARTWGTPSETLQVNDPDLGLVSLQRWDVVHLKKAAAHPLTLIRIECPQARQLRRDRRVVWLGWFGAPAPPVAEWWKVYFRRFAGDHWYRFAKRLLRWTLPRFKTPAQAECWSDLMPFLTWELWLARPVVDEKTLPWQKPMRHLSPGRVRQSLGAIFAQIGTPAQLPKPRGKSPGWPVGRSRHRAERFPIVKKRH